MSRLKVNPWWIILSFPAEEVEDGEVAEAVTKLNKRDPKVVNDVPAQTDKTFYTTSDTSVALLVHFYVHCE